MGKLKKILLFFFMFSSVVTNASDLQKKIHDIKNGEPYNSPGNNERIKSTFTLPVYKKIQPEMISGDQSSKFTVYEYRLTDSMYKIENIKIRLRYPGIKLVNGLLRWKQDYPIVSFDVWLGNILYYSFDSGLISMRKNIENKNTVNRWSNILEQDDILIDYLPLPFSYPGAGSIHCSDITIRITFDQNVSDNLKIRIYKDSYRQLYTKRDDATHNSQDKLDPYDETLDPYSDSLTNVSHDFVTVRDNVQKVGSLSYLCDDEWIKLNPTKHKIEIIDLVVQGRYLLSSELDVNFNILPPFRHISFTMLWHVNHMYWLSDNFQDYFKPGYPESGGVLIGLYFEVRGGNCKFDMLVNGHKYIDNISLDVVCSYNLADNNRKYRSAYDRYCLMFSDIYRKNERNDTGSGISFPNNLIQMSLNSRTSSKVRVTLITIAK
ncbi:MAG: hypothetical protein GY751_00330 [Bacteroidetes bacterium]|nr:hypothetical protein [Bacteroidota bacterium]